MFYYLSTNTLILKNKKCVTDCITQLAEWGYFEVASLLPSGETQYLIMEGGRL
jgi:hypothetical protein